MALSREQKRNARTILQVGRKFTKSRKVLAAGLEAGLVESNLTNVNYGDRDSLGVFQQRPSQGWGSPQQVRDVRYAAAQFFKRAAPLEKKYGTAGELAQAVQRSAFPGRYNQRRGEALSIYKSMGGKGGGGGGGKPKADPRTQRKLRQARKRGDAAAVRRIQAQMAGATKGKKGKKSKAPKTSGNRFAEQAKLATEIRYGGEKRELARALDDADQNLKVRAALEEGAASGIKQTLAESAPKVSKGYDVAKFTGAVDYNALQSALDKLGASADPFKAASLREETGRRARLDEAKQSALTETERRKAQAESGRAYGLRAAESQRDSDVSKIRARLSDIENEAGAFTAATYGSALEKQRDRNTKVKTANIAARAKAADRRARAYIARLKEAGLSARQAEKIGADWKKEVLKQDAQDRRAAASNATSRANALTSAGGKGGGGGRKPNTPDSRRTAAGKINQVENAVTQIRALEKAKNKPTSTQIRQYLQVKKGVPKDVVNAAYDVRTYGRLSPTNYKRMVTFTGSGKLLADRGWKPTGKPRSKKRDPYGVNPFG